MSKDMIIVHDDETGEATEKTVVDSKTCTMDSCLERTQALIMLGSNSENSQEMLQAPGDPNDIVAKTDKAIDIIKGSFRLLSVIPIPPANFAFGIFAEIGSFIQYTLAFATDKKDDIMEELKKLRKQIKELDKQAKSRFVDLKSFITEHHFAVEFITELSTLKRYMLNCLTDPCKESIDNFKANYEQNTPLNMAYTLMSLLSQDFTNPLILNLKNEKVKTKATFEKWEGIFRTAFGDFLLIEAMSSCFLKKEKCEYNCERLYEQYRQSNINLMKTKHEYGKNNESYWEEVSKYVPEWLDKNPSLTNAQKAEHLKNKMDGYLTNDAFYISVFNHYYNKEERYWEDLKLTDQIIRAYGPGKGNTFVYRSKMANEDDEKSLEEIKTAVEAFVKPEYKGKMPGALKKNPIANAGFTILYGDLQQEVRWANFESKTHGPGWCSEAYDFGGSEKRIIFVGYH